MDVNLCRLPDENSMMSKFLVPLAGFMWHPLLTDSAEILSKQAKRQFIITKNEPLRMVGISHPGKSDVHGMPQNFLLKSFSPVSAITCLNKSNCRYFSDSDSNRSTMRSAASDFCSRSCAVCISSCKSWLRISSFPRRICSIMYLEA